MDKLKNFVELLSKLVVVSFFEFLSKLCPVDFSRFSRVLEDQNSAAMPLGLISTSPGTQKQQTIRGSKHACL